MPTYKPNDVKDGYWGYKRSKDPYYSPSPGTFGPALAIAILIAILVAVLAVLWPLF